MRLRQDTVAASPLVVITTFVLGAVVLTAIAYAVFFDNPDPALRLVEQRGDETLAFEVSSTAGGLRWSEVHVQFLDRAGTDLASFLHLPEGAVERGQAITVEPLPAAGTYVLVATHDGVELARLAITI